jgi:16S rRNA processing protein RimM
VAEPGQQAAPGAGREPALLAGRIGRPHGLDGSFKVSGARVSLLTPGTVVRVGDRSWRVARRAGSDARPIVRLEGCDTREAAAALTGSDLRVSAPDAPALPEGEWWAEELEGCRVYDGDRPVGVVERMLGLPSCEALEVRRPDGGELIVPMVRDAIRAVDVPAMRIEIDLAFVEGTQ